MEKSQRPSKDAPGCYGGHPQSNWLIRRERFCTPLHQQGDAIQGLHAVVRSGLASWWDLLDPLIQECWSSACWLTALQAISRRWVWGHPSQHLG